ncbi:MAG: hypothetical protein NZ740_07395 [Kiritimatiellae bacterium]|nr:hypothetical protein [Kiritimatiellia bacterium]MDW8458923.1 hypothetical protein [Verrucomicrobiota bacterium]
MNKIRCVKWAGLILAASVLLAQAGPLYLTARTNVIMVSQDGGMSWSVLYSQAFAEFRGIAVHHTNAYIFVNDVTGGTINARALYAISAGGAVLATNFYNATGSFNVHPVGWYKGFVYVSAGSAGGAANLQMGVSSFDGVQFGNVPLTNANVVSWQVNDMAFAEWAGIDYMIVNGAGGMALRRYQMNPDATNGSFSSHVALTMTPVGGTFTGNITGVAVSPRGRIVLSTTRGLWLSDPYRIASNSLTMYCVWTNSETSVEDLTTGDMGLNARDIALDGSVLYVATPENLYRFNFSDELGTVAFISANPHGFSNTAVEIAVPQPLPGGNLPRLYLTGNRANVLYSTDGGSNWTRFARISGGQTRGLAVDPDSGTVFIADPTQGSSSARPIRAFGEAGHLLASNTYNATGSFNQHPLGFYNGRLYVSAGSAGGSSTQQVGMSAFDGTSFVHVPPVDAKVGNWQANDFAFASDGTNAYMLLNGVGGTTIRRFLFDSVANDGTVAGDLPLTLVSGSGPFPSTWTDLAVTESKRILAVGDNGFWISGPGSLMAPTVTLYNVYSFSFSENPDTGDMGYGARDFVLVSNRVYAITESHIYRYLLDDSAGTLEFESANPHGFTDGIMIAARLPASAPPLTPYQLWAQANITNGQTNELQDADGDGNLNWEEWVVDSNPMVSNAPFSVSSISVVGGNIRAHFNSSTARVYTLQYTTHLQGHWWSNVAGQVNVPGSGGLTNLVMPGVTNAALRVQVAVPLP